MKGVSMSVGAEDLAHHADQLQRAGITDPVIDTVRIFPRRKDPLVSQDRQVLGYVALGGTDVLYDILHAHLFGTEGAEDLEAERMGHRLERAGCPIDVIIVRE